METAVRFVGGVGRATLAVLDEPFSLLKFFFLCCRELFAQIFFLRFRWQQTLDQVYFIAVQSLPVVAFSLLFVSLMLILEFSFHMRMVLQQDSLVPAFST